MREPEIVTGAKIPITGIFPRVIIFRLQQSGAGEVILQKETFDDQDWKQKYALIVRVLKIRGALGERCLEFLGAAGFVLWDATNYFGDEFHVLHASVGITAYEEYGASKQDAITVSLLREINNAVQAATHHSLRFVTVQLDGDLDNADRERPVEVPTIVDTSDSVKKALAEAESAIARGEPVAAVDRLHTALHGHLRFIATRDRIPTSAGDVVSITKLLKVVTEKHPSLSIAVPHLDKAETALRGLASVVDSLNTIRNHGTISHPNDSLIGEDEAWLMVNAANAILNYLDRKTAPL